MCDFQGFFHKSTLQHCHRLVLSITQKHICASSIAEKEKEGDEQKDGAEEKPAEAAKKPSPALAGLLRARAAVEGLLEPQLHSGFLVSLNGVETGDIEAVVRARNPSDEVGFSEFIWELQTIHGGLQRDHS